MEYFDLIENIEYEDAIIKNLHQKIVLKSEIPQDYLQTYNITDGESLETIAFDLYGNDRLFWVLALVNDIDDLVFDLPLETSVLQKLCKNEVKTFFQTVIDSTHPKQTFLHKLQETSDPKDISHVLDETTNDALVTQLQKELSDPQYYYTNTFITFMDAMQLENDAKRAIKVVKPTFVKKFVVQVTEAVNDDSGVIFEVSE